MEKSAVSVLQEIMIKNNCVPTYDLILVNQGTHQNRFQFRVSCRDLSVDGQILASKKAAKCSAAEAMLKLIGVTNNSTAKSGSSIENHASLSSNCSSNNKNHVISSIKSNNSLTALSSISESLKKLNIALTPALSSDVDNAVSSSTKPSTPCNAVGKLQEFCVQNKLSEPTYVFVSTVGQSHNPKFTMRCTVGSVIEEATASTKKQAKHDVAYKIHKQLMESDVSKHYLSYKNQSLIMTGTKNKINTGNTDMRIAVQKKLTQQAKDTYKHLSFKKTVQKSEVPISLYHMLFKARYQEKYLTVADSLTSLTVLIQTNCFEEVMKYIQDNLDVQVKKVTFKTNAKDYTMIGFKLYTVPVILEIGIGKTLNEAKYCAMKKVLDTIMLMLK